MQLAWPALEPSRAREVGTFAVARGLLMRRSVMKRCRPPRPALLLALTLAAVAPLASACGDEDDSNGGPGEGGKADDPGAAAACSFDTPSPLGETTADLAETSTSRKVASRETAGELTDLEVAQVLVAVVHLEMAEPGVELADAFDASDDGTFEILDYVKGTDYPLSADWISFFAGDNEVGVVFAEGTTRVIAEVSDGDVMLCE